MALTPFIAICLVALTQSPHPGPHPLAFDQAKAIHHFYLHEDGGLIEITAKDGKDKKAVGEIRQHLNAVMKMFAEGHVPASPAMQRLRDRIKYEYEDVSGGGRLKISTRHVRALSGVHEFLRLQITELKTGDPLQ